MPWDRAQVCEFVRLSESALRRVEEATAPVPRVPLPGRGAAPVDRYDEDEVRAWWAARVADARAGRTPTSTAATRRPTNGGRARSALRLPFTVGEDAA